MNINEKELLKEQQDMCKKHGVWFSPPMLDLKLGISKNIKSGVMPINGLRHEPENGTSGWYIWAGEYSDNPDEFEPMHGYHLREKYPELLKYLALPPGQRFQIDDKGYEDVWFDAKLLHKQMELYNLFLSYYPQHKDYEDYIEGGTVFGLPALILSDILLTNVIDKTPMNLDDIKSTENLLNDLWGKDEVSDLINFTIKDSVIDHLKGEDNIISQIHLHGKAFERANAYLKEDTRPQFNSFLFK